MVFVLLLEVKSILGISNGIGIAVCISISISISLIVIMRRANGLREEAAESAFQEVVPAA